MKEKINGFLIENAISIFAVGDTVENIFFYFLELCFHFFSAMRTQDRTCYIIKYMSAHSAISYIHYTSHLPHHNPAPQASVTQYTSDTPWDFSKAAISSSVVPVV